jgi:hypothetical protein
MRQLDLDSVRQYVNKHIDVFHKGRLQAMKEISLHKVLRRKNPYLFKAKNVHTAQGLVKSILDAHLNSSEEERFGVFLEGLAIFVAEQTLDGRKSAATGIDLEFDRDGIRYLVTVKSGTNWGNSSQWSDLRKNFRNAVKILKQSSKLGHVQPVVGSCYGKVRTVNTGEFMKIAGQNFWHFISENTNLYADIIEPIGYRAKEHNDQFEEEKGAVINLFTRDFMDEFCTRSGKIDWAKLVRFNSGNLKGEEEH